MKSSVVYFLLIGLVGVCLAGSVGAAEPDLEAKLEYYKEIGRQQGHLRYDIDHLSIVRLLLNSKAMSKEDLKTIDRITGTVQSAQKYGDFWAPEVSEIEKAITSIKKDKGNPKVTEALLAHSERYGCQVFGITLAGKRVMVFNLLPASLSLERWDFYIRPVFWFDLNWPGSGTIFFQMEDEKVLWLSNEVKNNQ